MFVEIDTLLFLKKDNQSKMSMLFIQKLVDYLFISYNLIQRNKYVWHNFQSNFNFHINSLCSECLRCKLSSLYMFTLVVTKLILFYQKVANYLKALDQSWAVLKVFVTMTMNNFIILQHTELLLLGLKDEVLKYLSHRTTNKVYMIWWNFVISSLN